MTVQNNRIGEFTVVASDVFHEVGIVASGDRYREVPRELVDALNDAYAVLDPKHRGPAYARGAADGRLAAFADAADLTPVLASRTGLSDPAGELVGIARDLPDGTARDVLLKVAAGITGEESASAYCRSQE